MEELRYFETSVLTRATWRNIPEDAILHSHNRENLKPYAIFGDIFHIELLDSVCDDRRSSIRLWRK
jgi:hypothetical protein